VQCGLEFRPLALFLQRGYGNLRIGDYFAVAIDDRGARTCLLAHLRGEIGDFCGSIDIHTRGEHLCLLGEVACDLIAQRFLPDTFRGVNGRKCRSRYEDQEGDEKQDEHP